MIQESFNGKEPSRPIHIDEAVAFDAAVQAAFLADKGPECFRIICFYFILYSVPF